MVRQLGEASWRTDRFTMRDPYAMEETPQQSMARVPSCRSHICIDGLAPTGQATHGTVLQYLRQRMVFVLAAFMVACASSPPKGGREHAPPSAFHEICERAGGAAASLARGCPRRALELLVGRTGIE